MLNDNTREASNYHDPLVRPLVGLLKSRKNPRYGVHLVNEYESKSSLAYEV